MIRWKTECLHHLSHGVALGDDPNFACPLAIPKEIRENLAVFVFEHFSFDNKVHAGQWVAHKAAKEILQRLFARLLAWRFPIASMVPIAAYGWSDQRSMAANNSSGFNYRFKDNKVVPPELSMHAYGLAGDLNPWQNPCRSKGIWLPEGACYRPGTPGTITADSDVAKYLRDQDFICGVDWEEPFDPQHFELPLSFLG